MANTIIPPKLMRNPTNDAMRVLPCHQLSIAASRRRCR